MASHLEWAESEIGWAGLRVWLTSVNDFVVFSEILEPL